MHFFPSIPFQVLPPHHLDIVSFGLRENHTCHAHSPLNGFTIHSHHPSIHPFTIHHWFIIVATSHPLTQGAGNPGRCGIPCGVATLEVAIPSGVATLTDWFWPPWLIAIVMACYVFDDALRAFFNGLGRQIGKTPGESHQEILSCH